MGNSSHDLPELFSRSWVESGFRCMAQTQWSAQMLPTLRLFRETLAHPFHSRTTFDQGVTAFHLDSLFAAKGQNTLSHLALSTALFAFRGVTILTQRKNYPCVEQLSAASICVKCQNKVAGITPVCVPSSNSVPTFSIELWPDPDIAIIGIR